MRTSRDRYPAGRPIDSRNLKSEVRETSTAAGRTIRDLRIRHETGALVVSLRRADGSFDTTPEPDTPIEVGDVLIGVGSPDEIQALEDLFAPPRESIAG